MACRERHNETRGERCIVGSQREILCQGKLPFLIDVKGGEKLGEQD